MFRSLCFVGRAAVIACILVGGASTATAGAEPACADLGGTVDPDQICHVHSAAQNYTVDFNFPVDYPDQLAVSNYLTHERDDFIRYVAQRPPRPELPYQLDAKGTPYRSGSSAPVTASLVFAVYSETGAAHPVTYFDAFNYDVSRGASITFDTLFRPGTKPLDVLYPAVRRQLQKRFPSEQMYGGLDAKTYANFAITDDDVIFFFSQGQVLSQVAGPIEVSVPRAELASMLA